ncbi:hypothetical protein JMJ77_0001821 [Colletotrichum scovillei]|uniref:Uncharacterized protein n=1 Tax=Colletotrichum scovillei TaxID=1209932 RepID=A0A9P7R7V8_9PEZI|nr:hypothetical protein JMJ77_0001821 [Colletotrichum scovillei]KAG7070231.1 hypothetical protein JMJ76_0001487 [Colletotrichum scovillei]KAG7078482.1 hypothetical protein JMJ78_0002153 [Colletotrichum scovillei]
MRVGCTTIGHLASEISPPSGPRPWCVSGPIGVGGPVACRSLPRVAQIA